MTEFYKPIFPWEDLLIWYTEHGRHHLPWRAYEEDGTTDNDGIIYRVWLSEILLQQTQVDRVIPYFERILMKYPTIHDLARASYDEFFPYYQGMGYYSRARNILKTAVIVSEEYNGIFPREKNLLMKLPGVGGYTSSAILAFGSGESYLAWDTNLEKVFARYTHGRKDLKLSEREKQEMEEDFREYCLRHCEGKGEPEGNEERSHPGVGSNPGNNEVHHATLDRHASLAMTKPEMVRSINNALMDFASLIDLKNPENIDWEKYPIQSGVWYATRGSLEPREEKKSQSFPLPDATIIVILHKDHKVYYSLPLVISTEVRHERNGEILPEKRKDISTPLDMTETIGYSPFILPPSLTRDTRKYVQDSFREHYHLELSVRPVHKKWISEDGKPYAMVNAQIQAGKCGFREYPKKEAREVLNILNI